MKLSLVERAILKFLLVRLTWFVWFCQGFQAALGWASLCCIPCHAVPPCQERKNSSREFSLWFDWVCGCGLALNCPSAVTCVPLLSPALLGWLCKREAWYSSGSNPALLFPDIPDMLRVLSWVALLCCNTGTRCKELHPGYGVTEKKILQRMLRTSSPLKSRQECHCVPVYVYLLSSMLC